MFTSQINILYENKVNYLSNTEIYVAKKEYFFAQEYKFMMKK